MHYYQHHIGDFIKDTAFLTNEEVGIYMKLLWLYYDSEKPLPNNLKVLSLKVNARDKEFIVHDILANFFEFIDDEWHHSRCDKEIAEYSEFCAKQKANGLKGGRPKATQEKPKENPSVSQTEPKKTLTTNHKPLTTNHIDTPEGVSVDLWNDFLKHRKRLKADVTPRVVAMLIKEAEKAKMPLSEVLELILFKGWRSFEASWANSKDSVSKQADDKAWMFSDQGIIDKANELGVSSYGVANYHQLKEKVLFVLAKKAAE